MMQETIPVLLLAGYLGAGKTTLLNRILNNRKGIRFAVIVNDLGEVNIDADLIARGGIVGQENNNDLVALQNGCICCTLQTDLIRQLEDLCQGARFDYIVIEASGICDPAPIANTIWTLEHTPAPGGREVPRLDCIVAMVDALRLNDEFNAGEDIAHADRHDEDDIANLLASQIEFCNIVLLNKCDLVDATTLARIRRIVREIQPRAEIIETKHADVPLDKILYTGLFDMETAATSARWVQEMEGIHAEEHEHEHHHEHHHDEHHHDEDHHGPDCHCGHCHHHDHDHGEADEYGVATFVYQRRRPFNFDRFDRLADHWPKSIIRSKGVVYFSHNRDMSILFEQAGRQKDIKEAGLWLATAPKDELEAMVRQDPSILREWDPEYGDRMIKLVIIGRNMDRKKIEAELDACLD